MKPANRLLPDHSPTVRRAALPRQRSPRGRAMLWKASGVGSVQRPRKWSRHAAFTPVVLEMQPTEVLQCSDGKGVLNPLRQIAVLAVDLQY